MKIKTEREGRSVLFLRLPERLRKEIEVAAKQNLRSVTAEANYRLLNSFEPKQGNAAA